MQLSSGLETCILSYQGLRLSNLSKGRYDETFAGEDGDLPFGRNFHLLVLVNRYYEIKKL